MKPTSGRASARSHGASGSGARKAFVTRGAWQSPLASRRSRPGSAPRPAGELRHVSQFPSFTGVFTGAFVGAARSVVAAIALLLCGIAALSLPPVRGEESVFAAANLPPSVSGDVVVSQADDPSTTAVADPEDPFLHERSDGRVSAREEDALAYYWERRKASGADRVFPPPAHLFRPLEEVSRDTMLANARGILHLNGDQLEFDPSLTHVLGAPMTVPDGGDGGGTREVQTVRIAAPGLYMSLTTVQRWFCPMARRLDFFVRRFRVWPRFRFPSLTLLHKKLTSAKEGNFGEMSYRLEEAYPGDEDEPPPGPGPVLRVLELPPECFLKFLWIERFSRLSFTEGHIERADEAHLKWKGSSEGMTGVVNALESRDSVVKMKIGEYRFYEIVEELALSPQRQLHTVLDEEEQRAIRRSCEEHAGRESRSSFRRRRRRVTLRYCFFNADRWWLNESALGSPIFYRELSKVYGVSSLWGHGEISPNPIYLRAVLCGAMEESVVLLRDVVEKTTVSGASLRDWLLSHTGALKLSDVADLPPQYARAMDCSDESLLKAVKRAARKSDRESLVQKLKGAVAKVQDKWHNFRQLIKEYVHDGLGSKLGSLIQGQ